MTEKIYTQIYNHPYSHKQFVVEVHESITRQANRCHIVIVRPVAGGFGKRFVRYSRGQYAMPFGANLLPVAITSYYPGLSLRGLL